MDWTREIAAGYVAGIIDGEGSISTSAKHRAIRVSNTDMAILEAYESALRVLGIQFTHIQHAPQPPYKNATTNYCGLL